MNERANRALRAVGFDLWETLITDTPELSRQQEQLRLRRISEVFREFGRDCEIAELEHPYRETWYRCHELYWSHDRDIPARQQIIHLLEGVGISEAECSGAFLERLEEAYVNAALEIPPVAIPGAAHVLERLKTEGYAIGMISNTGRTPGLVLRRILEGLGLAGSIDVMVFSNEHGECKPRASIFEKLCATLGVPGSEMAFIGDNLYVDVHGAQQMGMVGIHFDPPVRGNAVAPDVDHGHTIIADATIASLSEIPPLLARLRRG